MKPFVFSLERMYNYKEQVFDKEKNELASLRKIRNDIEDEIDNLKWHKEHKRAEMNEMANGGMKAFELQSYKFYLENIDMQIKERNIALKKAEEAVAKQLEIVKMISVEISGLEKLEGKQKEEHRKKSSKENEVQILEYITTKIHKNTNSH